MSAKKTAPTAEEIRELLKTMSATKVAREKKGKSSFIIECSDLKTIEKFDNEQKGIVLSYISDFVMHDIEPDITTIEGMAANFFIQTVEKNNKRYLEICIQNSVNRNSAPDKGKKEESEEHHNKHIPQEDEDMENLPFD